MHMGDSTTSVFLCLTFHSSLHPLFGYMCTVFLKKQDLIPNSEGRSKVCNISRSKKAKHQNQIKSLCDT